MSGTTEVTLRLNGRAITLPAEPRSHLADFLREQHLLTGTHIGCEHGVCGACTLFVDGRPVRSCITLAVACQDAEVTTVEGFEEDALMGRLRQAFSRHHGLQCGYCTPGMLATAYDIVRRLPDADAPRIRRELAGNLCRCTGYAGIVAAIQEVLQDPPPAKLVPVARKSRNAPAVSPSPRPSPLRGEGAERSEAGEGDAAVTAGEIPDGVRLTRSLPVAASPDRVWAVLSDIPTVVSCIPGAALDGPPEGETLRGRCQVAVGPMRAAFQGTARVSLDAAARRGRVRGQGRDGLSRSGLEGALDFALEPLPDGGSRIDLAMVYRLKGPLAQFGRPALVEAIADRLLAEVGAALTARATGAEAAPAAPRPLRGLPLLGAAAIALIKRVLRRE
ncbi:carbon-monoxide dehydrogenase small subunit [Tistlia consotensis]|uniref:Carbon-monoxide dehydrogenase small subunit n=1 Tax=Tistlia consotensis USBA 355 TaxID=560819 RepID=A0A1Y6BZC5_9PROT|nr:2Fe-2S iron-sulfur cluster-binding protein [Tistlia consotensis]SMF37198.1 carbon-monoxide dehydrogenase small subunit [Tistlia consotensis USBA 355]SNR72556.1 carbon-monoxide dehydrogenase small subunit [Tistlia consotensis]